MDALRVDPVALSSGRLAPSAHDGAEDTGQYRGERATPMAPGGLSLDSMEEVSLHFAEKVEHQEFDEQAIEPGTPLQAMSAEQVKAYLDAAHQGAETDKLVALAKRMLAAGAHPGVLARQGFPDPTRQFLAMQYALQQGEREDADPAALQRLREALDDLDEDAGTEIRAHLNTVAVAATQGPNAMHVARFQSTYADLVLGAPTLAQTLRLALERFGSGGFASGLDRLVAALGQDIAAARPSTSPERLQALLQDLYQLHVVSTVLDSAHALADMLQHRSLATLDAVRLVCELVDLTAEQWLSGSRFTALAQRHGAAAIAARISFLTGVKAMLRDLPPRVYADMESRGTVLSSVQDALDAAIDEEERR